MLTEWHIFMKNNVFKNITEKCFTFLQMSLESLLMEDSWIPIPNSALVYCNVSCHASSRKLNICYQKDNSENGK